MYEDFDALVSLVRDVMPTAAVNKAVYGFDVFESLARYRERISGIATTEDFVTLLDGAINSCKGSHFETDSLTAAAVKADAFLNAYVAGFVTEDALKKHETYQPLLKQARRRNTLNIPLLYLRGDYFVRHDFTYGGKTYPRGLRIVRCNGRTPDEIVRDLRDTTSMLPWDFRRKQFYSSSFYANRAVARDSALAFVFESPAGERIEASFPADARVTFNAPARGSDRLVEYFDTAGILFIRVPSMNPEDLPFYKERIRAAPAGKAPRAAVIDIRGNGGGSDAVWMEILAALLDHPLRYQTATGVRNTELARRYLRRHPTGRYGDRHGKVRRIPFLGNEEFLVVEADATITPDDSVRVPVVYVLTSNVFSAAGSLTTVARLAAPIVSVGLRNPYILGRGIDPFHFSLPHSGFTFRIEPVIDLTAATQAEDAFHAEVEVELSPSLAAMLAYFNEDQRNLEHFLTNHDPFFRRVLELLAVR